MIRTPDWYYRQDARGAPWWRPALKPLAWLWQTVNANKRRKATPYRSSLFVISVGNLTVGGSGKTPVTGEILRLLAGQAIGLSKGHGGSVEGPARVAPSDDARHVGDEALMLAQTYPFMIAKDRAAGLRALEGGGLPVVVVDDAHQNLKIAKDLNILVVDGDVSDGGWPFGDGGIVPYGPLRESLPAGLDRADICVLWLPDADTTPDPELVKLLRVKPLFVARLTAQSGVRPGPVTAFAAIAKPWKFKATLQHLGFNVVHFQAFADHAVIPAGRLKALEKLGVPLITTQKDWVKLDAEWRSKVACLPIEARFDDESGFVAALNAATVKSVGRV